MVVSALQGLIRSVGLAVRRALGLSSQLHTEDRRILEQVVLPAYARRAAIERVLFVGCAPYTQRYGELFVGREYWTIDPVAVRRKYGSRQHIVDTLQNLGEHVAPEYFDLIVCNGVLGWGLNAPAEADAAFAACHKHLRPGGQMVLGWNDVAPRNRVLPDDVPALGRFEKIAFEAAPSSRWTVEGASRHVFDFYRKHRDPSPNQL